MNFGSKNSYLIYQLDLIDKVFVNPIDYGTGRHKTNRSVKLIGGANAAKARRDAELLLQQNINALRQVELDVLATCAGVIHSENIKDDIAAHILYAVTNPRSSRYNDYSGNLRRSYFVAFNGSEPHLYVANKNVSKKPNGSAPSIGSDGRPTEGKYIIRRMIHPVKKKMPKYRLITGVDGKLKRKKNKKQLQHYRRVKLNPRYSRVEAPWSLEPHQYIERVATEKNVIDANGARSILKINKAIFKRNARQLSADIVVGNYTPYRRFVEARGYDVIKGNNKSKWEKKISSTYKRHLNIAISQLGYDISKKRYMTARQNASMNSNNTGYKKYVLDSQTGKYKWVFDKLY